MNVEVHIFEKVSALSLRDPSLGLNLFDCLQAGYIGGRKSSEPQTDPSFNLTVMVPLHQVPPQFTRTTTLHYPSKNLEVLSSYAPIRSSSVLATSST